MRYRTLAVSAVMIWASALAPALMTAQGALDRDFPAGEGHDALVRVCSDCHGLETMQGRRSRAQWQGVVEDMTARGAQASEEDAKAIVDYLTLYRGRVNVNRATADEIRSVVELSAAEAAAIVEYRGKQGDFKTLDDLKKVPGVDAAGIDGKKDRIAFSGQ